jgi:hypothetical protein
MEQALIQSLIEHFLQHTLWLQQLLIARPNSAIVYMLAMLGENAAHRTSHLNASDTPISGFTKRKNNCYCFFRTHDFQRTKSDEWGEVSRILDSDFRKFIGFRKNTTRPLLAGGIELALNYKGNVS